MPLTQEHTQFSAPKSKAEYLALLDEAIRMARELQSMWAQAFEAGRRGPLA